MLEVSPINQIVQVTSLEVRIPIKVNQKWPVKTEIEIRCENMTTRSRPENEKPENKKLSYRFTFISPVTEEQEPVIFCILQGDSKLKNHYGSFQNC